MNLVFGYEVLVLVLRLKYSYSYSYIFTVLVLVLILMLSEVLVLVLRFRVLAPTLVPDDISKCIFLKNKANLRDLIAATGLVILLKLDPNHRFFSPCGLEIWWMTSKNNKAPLLHYIKLWASFKIHRWIQTEITVRKRPIPVKICDFFPMGPWNLMDDLGKR